MANVVTDLAEEESAKFAARGTVQANDMLDVHNFLKGFNFSDLFEK
ncbi:hypothetical protein ACFLXZ_00860 [Chloroflexota bacterium]